MDLELAASQYYQTSIRRSNALGDFQVFSDDIICSIIDHLSFMDVGRLACVSSVMYIFCNEEPVWKRLCLVKADELQYKRTWKKTLLFQEHLQDESNNKFENHSQSWGFSSLFLYRRLYRCNVSLDTFTFDSEHIERRKGISMEVFIEEYDGKKPALFCGLADTWIALTEWTMDKLLSKYADTVFRISQISDHKITMKLKDYAYYMKFQQDEEPLYIFDDKFGNVAPDLLNDYTVPSLFEEDFSDVLIGEERPPFRWLVIGPERSGSSWHVDPSLTSAWNTLLCGRKRWALYPPGCVPLGVTVHVNDDGDIVIDTPTSLQWWLDFYPVLSDHNKPIECTQLPGETIYVPSGWWHCVLNLETTIAVTQNYVNSKNFEFVCLDMSPGYRHKSICRAGLLAVDDGKPDTIPKTIKFENGLGNPDCNRKTKRFRISELQSFFDNEDDSDCSLYEWNHEYMYNINFLSKFIDQEKDHYNFPWSSGNWMGPRELRHWLCKLWAQKSQARSLIWKGACLAIHADKWLEYVTNICKFHGFPHPTDEERLPVGFGSNPVYFVADYVIKFFVEGGFESSLHSLGTELEFYALLLKLNSPLKKHIPEVLGSGFYLLENGSCKILPWDGKYTPNIISVCNFNQINCENVCFPFGLCSKICNDYMNLARETSRPTRSERPVCTWPYIVTKRCNGAIFEHIREKMSFEDLVVLSGFLGEQLYHLHVMPCPTFKNLKSLDKWSEPLVFNSSHHPGFSSISLEWKCIVESQNIKKRDVFTRLREWGDPIPSNLINKVADYLPEDFAGILNIHKDEYGLYKISKSLAWIHSDVMEDNIHMELCTGSSTSYKSLLATDVDYSFASNYSIEGTWWRSNSILDFSDLSIGDPLLDLIPIYLNIFRGDVYLLRKFLQSYKFPFMKSMSLSTPIDKGDKFLRLSYHAMCYCIMHKDNVLGAIFSLWKELRQSASWEEVEEHVWGELNNY